MDENIGLIVNGEQPDGSSEEEVTKNYDKQPWFPVRHQLIFLSFLGVTQVYALQASFNLCLVAMVNYTSVNSDYNTTDECPVVLLANSTPPIKREGVFDWDPKIQSYVLGSFYVGYTLGQLPGGYVATRFGAKYVLGLSVLFSGLLNLLIPVTARLDVYVLITLKLVIGFVMAPVFPASNALYGRWSPPLERSRAIALTTAGIQLGTVVGDATSGLLIKSGVFGGWPFPFIVLGSLPLFWFWPWLYMVSDSPADSKRISPAELKYIQVTTGTTTPTEYHEPPWWSIITSVPVWALIFITFTDGIGFFTILTCAPLYMKQVLKFDIAQNGLLMAVPYLVNLLANCISGPVADWVQIKGYLSTTATRKLVVVIGDGGLCVLLMVLSFTGCNYVHAVVTLVIAYGIYGLDMGGFVVNPLDLAPRYAGVVSGLCNMLGNTGGFIAPIMVEKITHNQPSMGRWRKVFLEMSAIYAMGISVFLVFGSGKEQPWAKEEGEQATEDNLPEKTKLAKSTEDTNYHSLTNEN